MVFSLLRWAGGPSTRLLLANFSSSDWRGPQNMCAVYMCHTPCQQVVLPNMAGVPQQEPREGLCPTMEASSVTSAFQWMMEMDLTCPWWTP